MWNVEKLRRVERETYVVPLWQSKRYKKLLSNIEIEYTNKKYEIKFCLNG